MRLSAPDARLPPRHEEPEPWVRNEKIPLYRCHGARCYRRRGLRRVPFHTNSDTYAYEYSTTGGHTHFDAIPCACFNSNAQPNG